MSGTKRETGGKVEVSRIEAGGGVVLRLMRVPCGKPNCHKCPHGPYWYAGYSRRGRWRDVYIGKSLLNLGRLKNVELAERIQRITEREDLDREALR